MNSLVVFDASAIVHTGTKSKFLGERRFYNYPVGGIHYLMRQVTTQLKSFNGVVVCFDSPTFRRNVSEGYKSGRKSSPDVISQLETVYDGLMSCGINCLKVDHYEADDLIEWVVADGAEKYSEVVIVGNDYDLCHSIRSNVTFKSIVQGVGCVNYPNFTTKADPGSFTAFNTISAKKALCGCKSDKIPPMKPLANGMKPKELYEKFVEFLGTVNNGTSYAVSSSPTALLVFANESGLFTPEEWGVLRERVDLVYPAKNPGGFNLEGTFLRDVNKNALIRFLSMYGDYDSVTCLEGRRLELSEREKQCVRDKASKLLSGEFAVDRSLQPEAKAPIKTIDLDCFTKEY